MSKALFFLTLTFFITPLWAQNCKSLLGAYPLFFEEGLMVHTPMTTLNKDVGSLFSGTHFVNLKVQGESVRIGAVFSSKVTETLADLYLLNGALYDHKISGVLYKDHQTVKWLVSIINVSDQKTNEGTDSSLIRFEEFR